MEKHNTDEKFTMSKGQFEQDKTKALYQQLLAYREKKSHEIIMLQEKHREPVVTIRANYPGLEKSNELTRFITAEIQEAFKEIFASRIKEEELYDTPEGLTQFYSVRGDVRTLKENVVYIEQNHPLGRFVNIDVYDYDEDYAVARIELFYEPRQCFLCDKPAKVCRRERNHKSEELIKYMEEKVSEYKNQKFD